MMKYKAIYISLAVVASIGIAVGVPLDSNNLSLKPSSSSNSNNYIPILRYENHNNGHGSYSYLYETGNGIYAQEKGELKKSGALNQAQTAEGSFTYTSLDGEQFSMSYTADENGFQPQGAHLPTPPPIPKAILKSIEFNIVESAREKYNVPKAVLPIETEQHTSRY